MSIPHTDTYIEQLKKAFLGAFKLVLERHREGRVRDFGGEWAEVIASFLDDLRITAAPGIDIDNPTFPFIEIHRLHTDLYVVARSGMRGGPAVDVLLQLWFDTEEMLVGYGVPLVFSPLPRSGTLPEALWGDLRETCRHINMATPSGRLVFIDAQGDSAQTDRPSGRHSPILAIDMNSFGGTRVAPAPLRGRHLEAFCQDLASGWIGDPALSGLHDQKLLNEFMTTCRIGHIVRIRIERDNPTPIWRTQQLPF